MENFIFLRSEIKWVSKIFVSTDYFCDWLINLNGELLSGLKNNIYLKQNVLKEKVWKRNT